MLILENYEQSKPPQGGIFLPEKPIPDYLAKKIERIDEIYEDSIEAQKVLNGVIGTSEGLQRIGKLTTYFVEESLRSDGNVPSEVSEEVAHVEELMYRAAGYTGLCSALSRRGEQITRWVIECPDIISALEPFGYTFSEVGGKARLTIAKQSGRWAVFNYFGKFPNKSAMQYVQPADHFYLLHHFEEAVSNGSLKVPISLVRKARPKKRSRPNDKPVVKTRVAQVASAEEKTLLKNTITLREDLTDTTFVEAWNQQNQLFLSTFSELLKPDTSTIFQYGVGPDGQLLNLKDIKVQLARRWLGVMTLLFKNSENSAKQHWILRVAEANYKGFYDYEIPINYNDAPIIERYFDPQHQPAGVSECDGSMIVPWAVDILSSSVTIDRAESIAIARHKLRQESRLKSQENDEALQEKQSKAIAKVLSQLLLK